jgi:glycosyltransferase involved in cell wall biosynthesis
VPVRLDFQAIRDGSGVTVAAAGHLIFLGVDWLLALGWLRVFAGWLVHGNEIRDIAGSIPDDLPALPALEDGGPHLTVIVPARNEELDVKTTIRSLLASQGIRLQVIAVDDRSTDATGRILDQLVEGGSEINGHTCEVVHVVELPRGWLGKPHALALAAQSAKADWILFTDGDVRYAPEAAALALRYAISERADHFVLMPDWILGTAGEAAMHGAMHALTAWGFRPWRIADPKSRDFLGVGAFNMIRKGVYEEIGGFEALRMEVLEDLRLGWMVKRHGYRQRFAVGKGLAAVRWSQGAIGVVRNLEKNLFALYRYRTGLAILGACGLAVQAFLPLLGLAMGGWILAASVMIYASVVGIYMASQHVTRVPAVYAIGFPIASALFLFALIRSVFAALIRGGVVWRETLYPLEELRAKAGPFW